MPAERKGKRRGLAVNSLFSVVAWLFPIMLGFVATPILVRGLGSEQYGLFAIVLGFISYSFTFGVGKVVGKYIPELEAAGKSEQSVEFVSATFWFSLFVGILGSVTLILTAPVIVNRVLLISPENQQTAINSLYLAGAIGVGLMLSQVFQFVLQGLHRFDNYVTITNLNGLLLGAGNIILALNGFGVVALLVWNFGLVILTGLVFFVRAKQLFPVIDLWKNASREVWITVLRYAGNIILYQIFANVLFIFERSWVMRKFGPAALTFYFVPMLLAIYLQGFVASIVQAVFPVVNEVLGDRDRVIELYKRANKLILVIVVFAVTNFIACGSLFLKLWMSAELASESYSLLVFHGLSFGIISVAVMAYQLAEVFKFPALNVIMTGAWMVIAIPLMIVAAERWGSDGVAAARLAATLVTIPIIAYSERRFLGNVLWRFWLAVGARILVAAAAMALVERTLLNLLGESYLSLFAAGSAGALVFAIAILLTRLLTPEEREIVSRNLDVRKQFRGTQKAAG
ncbi:MAG TPA: oligosaccharide flippase family protein [Pyrinomonadaceae bacterium]|nr:oligosaccharide flippase family protein [Pyrinomonadaceae bacterium]